MNFNMKYLSKLKLNDPVKWMGWVPTTTHELIHALGFTQDMFQSFRNA